MKTLYTIIMTLIAVALLTGAFIYGVDREVARRDFEREWNNGNHEATITGCIYESNCEYYTKLLHK